TRTQAARLMRDFQGSAKQLPHDWRQEYLSPQIHAPVRVGKRLLVVAETIPSDRPQLIVPAAGAFGTGEHATTAMCLRLLEEATRKSSPGWRLLDAGTGTGILALAARRFGAGAVLGLDSDPVAVAHARQNARLNHISRVRFLAGDVLTWKPVAPYDLITANLFSELLIAALPIFRRTLRSKGRLIVSGILRAQAASVVHALGCSQFRLKQQRRRGKWVALLASRKT
ncbi:MAG TPA: 50S ribosomal protein L11 methyltransferase, partial [Chthoniobacterales bacterium]|nr:50S ribosomal protein L11 methyltransferase [Chthoniobacterales bacterium]